MREVIFTGWNFMRALRVFLGGVILYQSILAHDSMYGFAGALFMLTGIFNIGCCGAGGCSTGFPTQQKAKAPVTEEVEYEEINSK